MKKTYIMPFIKMARMEAEPIMSLSVPIDHTINVANPDEVLTNEMHLMGD